MTMSDFQLTFNRKRIYTLIEELLKYHKSYMIFNENNEEFLIENFLHEYSSYSRVIVEPIIVMLRLSNRGFVDKIELLDSIDIEVIQLCVDLKMFFKGLDNI